MGRFPKGVQQPDPPAESSLREKVSRMGHCLALPHTVSPLRGELTADSKVAKPHVNSSGFEGKSIVFWSPTLSQVRSVHKRLSKGAPSSSTSQG